MDKTIIRLVGAAIVAALAFAATSMVKLLGLHSVLSLACRRFILMNISRIQLGKSFSIMPEAKTLVTTGLYARIQHPMYVFLDLFLVSVIVGLALAHSACGLGYCCCDPDDARSTRGKGARSCLWR